MPIISGGSGGGGGGNALIQDLAWTAPAFHTGNDEFTGSSPPAWSQVTPSGSATFTEGNGVLGVQTSGQSSAHLVGFTKAITISQGGFIETSVRLWGFNNSNSNPLLAGLVLSDGTAAGSNVVYCGTMSVGPSLIFAPGTYNAANSLGAGALHALNGSIDRLYYRLIWQAANTFRVNVSLNGTSWQTMAIADVAKTMTPTQMGVCCSDWAGALGGGLAIFDYFRCSG